MTYLPGYDPIALVAEDGARILLSGPDDKGYQTPELFGFTAVSVIVRLLPSGHLMEVPLPEGRQHFREGYRIEGFGTLNLWPT